MTFNWRLKPLEPGTKVHDLTIVNATDKKYKDGSVIYLCSCICGKQVEQPRSKLNGRKNKSCGCRVAASRQKPPGEVSFKVLHTSYKKRAEIDELEFKLTLEDFKKIVSQNCAYCGLEPKKYNTYVHDGNKSRAIRQESVDRAWIKANGIDRIDPDIGYILENCTPCCSQCNYAKSDYTKEEFLEHNKRLYNYQKAKNVDF